MPVIHRFQAIAVYCIYARWMSVKAHHWFVWTGAVHAIDCDVTYRPSYSHLSLLLCVLWILGYANRSPWTAASTGHYLRHIAGYSSSDEAASDVHITPRTEEWICGYNDSGCRQQVGAAAAAATAIQHYYILGQRTINWSHLSCLPILRRRDECA